MDMDKKPVFIHSLWRTNSTYWFSKFREQPECLAFNEPFHPHIDPDRVSSKSLRHPIDDPFTEYGQQSIPLLFQKRTESLYPFYLSADTPDELVEKHVSNLIAAAEDSKRRAVICPTRSTMRIPKLSHQFDGVHIYL